MKTRFQHKGFWALILWVMGLLPACSLSSDKWDIHPDAQKIDFHQQFLAAAPTSHTTAPPNIVLILADDLGKTDISIYGGQHQQMQKYDQQITNELIKAGYKVLRFWNNEILQETQSVLEAIRLAVVENVK